jgi:hypothetical protein
MLGMVRFEFSDGLSRRPRLLCYAWRKAGGCRNAQFSSKAAFHNPEASIFYWTGRCDCVAGALEALRTDGTILRGDDLLDFSRAEDAVTEIIRRISEILENVHAKRP